MTTSWIIIAAIALVLYGIYFSLIVKKNKVREALSGVDVQLKKRSDLIPNILTMAGKFMTHEKSLLEEITRLRTEAMSKTFTADGAKKVELENLIDKKMKDLLISVESYPDLKSDQTMLQAMQSFEDVEEHIAAARRFYNAAVNDLKNAVEIFPSSLIAKIIGVKADLPFFAATEDEKKSINASDYIK